MSVAEMDLVKVCVESMNEGHINENGVVEPSRKFYVFISCLAASNKFKVNEDVIRRMMDSGWEESYDKVNHKLYFFRVNPEDLDEDILSNIEKVKRGYDERHKVYRDTTRVFLAMYYSDSLEVEDCEYELFRGYKLAGEAVGKSTQVISGSLHNKRVRRFTHKENGKAVVFRRITDLEYEDMKDQAVALNE